MERKINLKKFASILLTFMVTISMMLPSIFMPKEVSADTRTTNISIPSSTSYYTFWVYGKSNLGSKLAYFTNTGHLSTFSATGFKDAYCMSPFMTTPPTGTKTAYKTGLSSVDERKMGAGLYYIYNQSGLSGDSARASAEYFVWNFLSGKPCYKGSVAYSIDKFDITAGDSGTVTTVYNNALNYANNNYTKFKAETYCTDFTPPNSQPVFCINYDFSTGYAKLKKVTKSNKHLTDLCPEQYSIAGATYGVYSDSACTSAVSSFVTDENGNSNTIELNESRYYAKETKAPKGYKLDPTVYTLDVKAGETTLLNVADEPLLDPFKLKLVKKAEEGADKNLTLEGAEYTVKYYKDFLNKEEVKTATPFRTWIFRTDKNGVIKLADKWKVGGDEFFRNEKGNPVGLRGTYVVEEIKAPKGLARTEGIISLQQFTGEVVKDGTIPVMKDVTDVEKTQKVNIKIQKKDAETGEAKPQGYGSFAGAKFNVWMYDPLQLMDVLVGTIVTNENGTGELVKLAPGVYTIEEIEAPAGYNKNPNKVKIEARIKEPNTAYFDYLATIAEKPITVTARKTSFDEVGAVVPVKGAVLALYTSNDEKVEEWTTTGKVHTFKGLAKGKYVIKELVTPKGYLPLEQDYHFTVEETEKVQEQDIFNEPIPEIKSIATFDTGAKESLPKDEVTVNDKFELKKLRRDFPYELRTKLVEKDNISNVIAEKSHQFFASDYSQEIDLKYTFNAKELEGKRLVVLAELHRLNRKGSTLVAVHKDINNVDETVVIPEIKTTAKDKKDGGKDLLAGEKQTIIDKVSYTNLIIGRKYKVSGKLMNKEIGKPILDNGKEVTAEKEFTAETSNGFVNLEFTFNAKALAGKTVVVFEDVYQDKIKVATHADITDEEQSVYIPKIGTKLTGKDTDEKEFHAFDKIELRDVMKYENLIKGKVYYAKGEIINKKTGKAIQKAEGNFIADEESGEASLDFTINAKDLKGSELVCFEEIYTIDDEGNPNKPVALHKDINDKGQTVKIVEPKIGTRATTDNGKKEVTEKKEITITDKVAYQDLIIGKEYTIKGKLMDKTTGKTLIVNGKEVIAEKKFTAKEKSGFEELTFTFDGIGLGGKTVVVFEDVYEDGKLIGTHSDINDLGQSIKIIKKPTPKTGDKENYIYYVLGLLVAGSAITYIRVKRERK